MIEPGPRRKLGRRTQALIAASLVVTLALGGATWVLVPRWFPYFTLVHSPWVEPAIRASAAIGESGDLLEARIQEWGDTALGGIAWAYRSRSPLVRIRSLDAAEMLGSKAAEALMQRALGDPADEVRVRAVAALGNRVDGRLTAPLTAALADRSPRVRVAAIAALGRIGGSAAMDAVAPLIVDPDADVRHSAAFVLVMEGSEGGEAIARAVGSAPSLTATALVALTIDGEEHLQLAVADALCALDDPATIAALYDLAVRWDAPPPAGAAIEPPGSLEIARCYGRIAETLRRHLSAGDGTLSRLVREGVGSTMPARRRTSARWIPDLGSEPSVDSMNSLLPLLVDADPSVAAAARGAIRRMASPATQRPLIGLAADPSPELRATAISALGHVASREAGEALVRGLGDRERSVRAAAFDALVSGGHADAVAPLLELSRNASGDVLALAVAALADLGDQALEPMMIRLLCHGDPRIRWLAARGLGRFGSAAARPDLERLIASDDSDADIRAAAANALSRCGGEALPALERATHDSDPEVAQQARAAIAGITSGR